jgi:hypothetical protein
MQEDVGQDSESDRSRRCNAGDHVNTAWRRYRILDGNFVGSTPSSLNVSPGEHSVNITKTGYAPWNRKIKITSGNIKISAELEAVSPTAAK